MPQLRTAVLISGAGRTLKNLLDAQSHGRLQHVDFNLVISNNPSAAGLKYADCCTAKKAVVDHRNFISDDDFSQAVFEEVQRENCDFIVLAGFLRRLIIPDSWLNRVINIHPSLIPMFCGHGFYGKRVHQAALDYGVKVSGCTVHFVNNEYDSGPIILQKTVPVYSSDSADALAARVLEAEFSALPETLELISAGRVCVDGRKVDISAQFQPSNGGANMEGKCALEQLADMYEEQGEARGIALGEARGRALGKASGKAESILYLLRRRFGHTPKTVENAINRMQDIPVLDSYFELAFDCQSMEEFEAALPNS